MFGIAFACCAVIFGGRCAVAKSSDSAPPTSSDHLPVWPKVSQSAIGVPHLIIVSPSLKITGYDSPVIPYVQELLFENHQPQSEKGQKTGNATVLTELAVVVDDHDISQGVDTDESYELELTVAARATLKAATWVGAVRGLETFRQLVVFDTELGHYKIWNGPLSIKDEPLMRHRGLLLDVARHYYPVPTIKKLINNLMHLKMNVLHLHLMDSQSVPIESRALPELWNAALSEGERYTIEDMRSVVAFAKSRGVRVVPEFDVPGHTSAWAMVYPDMFISDGCPKKSVMHPLKNVVYERLFKLLDEYLGGEDPVFTDRFVHLGGDEVGQECWMSSREVKKMAQDQKIQTSKNGLYNHFMQQVRMHVAKSDKIAIMWDEAVENGEAWLDGSDTVIQYWRDWQMKPRLESLLEHRPVIFSPDTPMYLDGDGRNFVDFYNFHPFDDLRSDLQPAKRKNILGGEVALWSERLDPSDFELSYFTATMAQAERLWSPYEHHQQHASTMRFFLQDDKAMAMMARASVARCGFLSIGIEASPLLARQERDRPQAPGSCLVWQKGQWKQGDEHVPLPVSASKPFALLGVTPLSSHGREPVDGDLPERSLPQFAEFWDSSSFDADPDALLRGLEWDLFRQRSQSPRLRGRV